MIILFTLFATSCNSRLGDNVQFLFPGLLIWVFGALFFLCFLLGGSADSFIFAPMLILKNLLAMKQSLTNVWRFYRDGFRGMTLGRTLWLIILIKLFVIFFVLRLFFFPDFLNSRASDEAGQSDYVGRELIQRAVK